MSTDSNVVHNSFITIHSDVNKSDKQPQLTPTSKFSDSLICTKGFVDVQKLFFCAQKNYIELYVLGVGKENKSESWETKASNLLKLSQASKRTNSNPDVSYKIQEQRCLSSKLIKNT